MAGPRDEVVLDAVAGEDLDVAVVHRHREVDRQLALRHPKDSAKPGVEAELVGGLVELLLGDGPDVRGFGDGALVGHRGRTLSLAVTGMRDVAGGARGGRRAKGRADYTGAVARCPPPSGR